MLEEINVLYKQMLQKFEGGLSNTSTKKFDDIVSSIANLLDIPVDEVYATGSGSRPGNLEVRLSQGVRATTHTTVGLGFIVDEKNSPSNVEKLTNSALVTCKKFLGRGKAHYDNIVIFVESNGTLTASGIICLQKTAITDKLIQELNIENVQIVSASIAEEGDNTSDDMPFALQIIYYGAPGTGKSHEVKEQTGELLVSDEEVDLPNVFRTTFHPDTDYAAFVGCYKPTMRKTGKKHQVDGKDVDDEEIIYEYVPQVFTDAYVYAYTHLDEPTYLVIEEINRGNCAQIFGDLFQLLDRKNGKSEYKIKADKDLAKYLEDILGVGAEGIKDRKLCLPVNLHILATMNTSDQSLFPMDSAFKRRWEWEYVPINYDANIKSGTFEITIGEKTYSWVDFIKKVNKHIFDLTQSEDKQMGNFFIKHSVNEKEFKSKVMFYLWYEVLRDETGHNMYFFCKKESSESKDAAQFTFKNLYESNATETLHQFMAYLGVSPK